MKADQAVEPVVPTNLHCQDLCTYKGKGNPKLNSQMSVIGLERAVQEVLHTGNTIVAVASDVKPSARIDKGWIPTLKNIVRVS